MLSRCALTTTECLELHNYCVEGIRSSSPFNLNKLVLSSLGLFVKIPSGGNNIYLTKFKTNWSIILSTGMSNLGEVELALIRFTMVERKYCLLHCVGDYPASAESMNLKQSDSP